MNKLLSRRAHCVLSVLVALVLCASCQLPWTNAADPSFAPVSVVSTAGEIAPNHDEVAGLSLPASAIPRDERTGASAEQGHAALALVNFDPSTIGYTVSFLPGSERYLGLTHTTERRIEILIRPGMSLDQIAYILAHEIGHAVDHILNSDEDRDRWRVARGINASMPWWPMGTGPDRATPAGDFAECFAEWAVGATSHSTWGGCQNQLDLVAELAAG